MCVVAQHLRTRFLFPPLRTLWRVQKWQCSLSICALVYFMLFTQSMASVLICWAEFRPGKQDTVSWRWKSSSTCLRIKVLRRCVFWIKSEVRKQTFFLSFARDKNGDSKRSNEKHPLILGAMFGMPWGWFYRDFSTHAQSTAPAGPFSSPSLAPVLSQPPPARSCHALSAISSLSRRSINVITALRLT